MGTAADDSVTDIAADTRRSAVYAVGTTDGSLDGPNKGSTDVFLKRYNRSGAVVWKRQLGGNADDGAGVVAVDRNGDLYVGYSSDTNRAGGVDVSRLEKRRGDGTLVWVRTLTRGEPELIDVATDANGNVYALDRVFHPEEAVFTEIVLRKYTGAGSLLWTRAVAGSDIDGSDSADASGLGTDASGNSYIAVAGGDDDGDEYSLVYKYSSAGTELFSVSVPPEDDRKELVLRGLTVRGDGLYVVGTSSTRLYLGSDEPPDDDAFVAELSLGGVERWRRVFSASNYDGANDVSADANGGVYVTGYTRGNLGGAQLGGVDIFLRKFSTSGSTVWTKQIGTRGNDAGNTVIAYSSSELYLAGEVGGALTGGTYRGRQDGFLRRSDGSGSRVWVEQ